MENERTENIFYPDVKHVHKYGSAKFQPNPLFSSQEMGTEHAAGKKKSRQNHWGSRRNGMPQLGSEFKILLSWKIKMCYISTQFSIRLTFMECIIINF